MARDCYDSMTVEPHAHFLVWQWVQLTSKILSNCILILITWA